MAQDGGKRFQKALRAVVNIEILDMVTHIQLLPLDHLGLFGRSKRALALLIGDPGCSHVGSIYHCSLF